MNSRASRRNFLVAGLGLPAAALATPQTPRAQPSRPASEALAFRTLGKTGLKVTSVGFGCMVTSDASVISRVVDMGINYFDTARTYGGGNNERMVGSAPALASLKWVLRNQRMGTTIPSMTDSDQLEENFRAMSEPFGAPDAKLLAAIDENIRPLYCRMCYQCSGQCPKGAAVPETIRYLSYADYYGQFALGREHFASLPPAARAVRCGECESCSVACPNGVHVAERMIRAQELFG